MSDEFGNLHLHTHSSLIDGLGRPAEVVAKVKDLGQEFVAVTDHGTLAGVPDMYREAKKAGVQLIVGQELYIVPDAQALGFGDKGNLQDGRNFHLTMLAKNEQGYRELVKLTSWAQRRDNRFRNFYGKPRIDHELLTQVDTEHLIALSGCVMGELSETFLKHLWPIAAPKGATKYDQWKHAVWLEDHPLIETALEDARQVMKFYRELFPDGQYIYEFMYHGFAPESWVHMYLVPEAKKYGLKIVATNDSHYVHSENSEAHNLLMSIQWKEPYCAKPDDPKMLDVVSRRNVLKRLDGLLPRKDILAGIKTTEYIADLCVGFKLTPLEKKATYMPKAKEDDGTVIDKPIGRIRVLSEGRLRGLCERYPDRATEYTDRFERELRTIKKLKYQHYFLVTAGILRRAAREGIVRGAGRGSGAGSLVAYCLGITQIDPIRHDLLFERFLNPAKKSLPDFDNDIESERIDEVFDMIEELYGTDRVKRVGTYSRYAPKALMTDLLKFLPTRLDHESIKAITKGLPDDTRDRKDDAFMETWWRDLRESDDSGAKELLRLSEQYDIEGYSQLFYGIRKSVGKHAAGVIITDGRMSISEWVPDQLIASSDTIVTQYDMNDLADMGFVKFDILSLSTLSQVAENIRLIGHDPFPEIPDYDDPKSYKLITAGHTDGMFQLTGYAAKQVIRGIQGVHNFEDIVAVMALGRPGAIKFIEDFRAGRENPDSVEYADEDDKAILSKSYGVVLYQEQVMSLGWAIGMTDDEVSGDISLLTAIKKYSKTLMDQVEPIFRRKAKDKGWAKHMIDLRWRNIEDYVGYGFNRSHAVCYADLAYKTAYLKANYPAEFIVSRLNQATSMSDKKKQKDLLQALVQDARRVGVKILPPHINKSNVHHSVTKNGNIRWGLVNVKGIGDGAAKEMVKHRPFKRGDWRDTDTGPRGGAIKPYLRRVEVKKCTSAAVKAIMEVGGFPGVDPGDDLFTNEYDRLFCNITEHHNKKTLKQIKAKVLTDANLKIMRKKKHGEYKMLFGGVVHTIKEVKTQRGRQMAFVKLTLGPIEFDVTMFQNLWEGERDKRGNLISKGIGRKVKRGSLLYGDLTKSYSEQYGWGYIVEGVNIYK